MRYVAKIGTRSDNASASAHGLTRTLPRVGTFGLWAFPHACPILAMTPTAQVLVWNTHDPA